MEENETIGWMIMKEVKGTLGWKKVERLDGRKWNKKKESSDGRKERVWMEVKALGCDNKEAAWIFSSMRSC